MKKSGLKKAAAAAEITKRKGGVGRRKIPIEKIQKPERLRSCFSKRYSSLFQKAHVLQDLRPGSRVAIIVQCPNGWEFKASEPDSDVRSVVDTYLSSIDEDELDEFDEIHQIPVSDHCAGTSTSGGEIESLSPNSEIGFPSELEYGLDQSFPDQLWIPEDDNSLDDLGLLHIDTRNLRFCSE